MSSCGRHSDTPEKRVFNFNLEVLTLVELMNIELVFFLELERLFKCYMSIATIPSSRLDKISCPILVVGCLDTE